MKIKRFKLFLFTLALVAASAATCKFPKIHYQITDAYAAKSNIKNDIKKVLSLKEKNYQNLTLKYFGDSISAKYENDNSLWHARQRIAQTTHKALKKQKLSDEDYYFLTVTLPCTESESDYKFDRSGQMPSDFSDTFDIYSKSRKTKCHFEYAVRYSTDFAKTTVGERDSIIIKIKEGMRDFVKNSPLDPADKKYLKKLKKHLNKLIEENTCSNMELVVFQCAGN